MLFRSTPTATRYTEALQQLHVTQRHSNSYMLHRGTATATCYTEALQQLHVTQRHSNSYMLHRGTPITTYYTEALQNPGIQRRSSNMLDSTKIIYNEFVTYTECSSKTSGTCSAGHMEQTNQSYSC